MLPNQPSSNSIEVKVFEILQEIAGPLPLLKLNQKLKESAIAHSRSIVNRSIKHLHDNFDERKSQFPNYTKFTEICFISSQDPQIILSTIRDRYSSRIKSGINQVGISIINLTSGRSVVTILMAFQKPILSSNEFKTFQESLSKISPPPFDSPDATNFFLNLINQYRQLIQFPPFETLHVFPSPQTKTAHFNISVSNPISFFIKCLQNSVFNSYISEIWDEFNIIIEKGKDSSSIIHYKFIFNNNFISANLVFKIQILPEQPSDKYDSNQILENRQITSNEKSNQKSENEDQNQIASLKMQIIQLQNLLDEEKEKNVKLQKSFDEVLLTMQNAENEAISLIQKDHPDFQIDHINVLEEIKLATNSFSQSN